ncbi:NAD-dependent epimerase/dehydratase family protein [Rhizobium bangladeshense]|uniref:NAD-dependent epimerase/dehydratase family protein n=1 Tax=Rhizobium bangladeshense TaxID=1138189 RepID=UPI002180BB30|nr:NAD-dependent epimerase/dehydratase family protein [Rhizobium bangladeshense]
MKTVLISGGAGFIGSHLCDRLLLRTDVVNACWRRRGVPAASRQNQLDCKGERSGTTICQPPTHVMGRKISSSELIRRFNSHQ